MTEKLKTTLLKLLFMLVMIGGVNMSASLVSAASPDAASAAAPEKSSPLEEWEEWGEEIFPWKQ